MASIAASAASAASSPSPSPSPPPPPSSPRSSARLRFLSSSPPPALPTELDVSGVVESLECVLILQHSDRVPPAFTSFFLESQSTRFVILAVDQPDAVLPPVTQRWKAIVSLGGPQGAYEEEQYAWIALEKAFLLAHISASTPVLAICLGAQMLAHACGGRAYAAPPASFEVGYPAIRLTEEGAKDEQIKQLFEQLQEGPQVGPAEKVVAEAPAASNDTPAAAHPANADSSAAWREELGTPSTVGFLMHHGDTFDLPVGVPCLATSSAGFKQLFRFGSALAVQFHPEAGVHQISTWTKWNPKRYLLVGSTAEKIVNHVEQQKEAAFAHSLKFFQFWWKSAGFELKPVPHDAQA